MKRAGVALIIAGALGAAAGIGAYFWQAEPGISVGGPPFVHSPTPKALPDLRFRDAAGREYALGDFRGKVVLLNIWATWCAPCREEMPALDRLQAKLGGKDFEVVALSVDQQGLEPVRKFFDETRLKTLKPYIDPNARAGFELGVLGLPATLLVDREGREIGRHIGPAEWDEAGIVERLRRTIAEGAAQ